MNSFKKYIKKLSSVFKQNPIQSTILIGILAAAYFVRVYRVDQLLGFYYDQGRDAKVIWDLIHKGDFFLIGPTTGIEGIFRGPWYYWLITPFYLLGGGSPILPAVFLASTTIIAIAILYKLAREADTKTTAFFALIIASFSHYLVYAARWLSNPTPMMLISMLLLWCMFLVIDEKRWAWAPIGFLLGQAMQFGSATEIFYFIAIGIFAIWQRKNLPGIKIAAISFGLILLGFLPQIIFDIRNQGILSSNIGKFLLGEGGFKVSFWQVVQDRAVLYKDVFYSKLFPITTKERATWSIVSILLLLYHSKRILRNKKLTAALLLFATPLVGMVFFQGNEGYIFDYYFTGYYFIFVFLIAVLLGLTWKAHIFGKALVVLFLFIFLKQNILIIRNYITSGVDGATTIALGNQIESLDWIYKDLGVTNLKYTDPKDNCPNFNTDVYVPPVIPHAYDYLFRWYGGIVKACAPVDQQVPLLYTLYETDPPHPERLEAWLARQEGIGKIVKSESFGGITVQRRIRINSDANN